MKRLGELFWAFFRIGALTFGGGYAMIALLDHECVEKRQWLTADELMDITVVAESTPGPIAINCATYTGWRQAGLAGAVSATVGIVLPAFLLFWGLSFCFEELLDLPVLEWAFRGIRAAVAVLVLESCAKSPRDGRSVPDWQLRALVWRCWPGYWAGPSPPSN